MVLTIRNELVTTVLTASAEVPVNRRIRVRAPIAASNAIRDA